MVMISFNFFFQKKKLECDSKSNSVVYLKSVTLDPQKLFRDYYVPYTFFLAQFKFSERNLLPYNREPINKVIRRN